MLLVHQLRSSAHPRRLAKFLQVLSPGLRRQSVLLATIMAGLQARLKVNFPGDLAGKYPPLPPCLRVRRAFLNSLDSRCSTRLSLRRLQNRVPTQITADGVKKLVQDHFSLFPVTTNLRIPWDNS